ncbi:MAG: RNA-binding protein [Lachnospiraceae bacterium]|nr:RNA-binding protein [Lachnospiraceae bacterium]
MLELGKIQKLKIVRKVDFGLYLADPEDEDYTVLLPIKQAPEGAETGEELEVFLFRDSEDRLICTTTVPKITLGEIAWLECRDIGEIGGFLDMGLERDLFLPYHEMLHEVREGDLCLVAMYVDKSGRLCATEHIYEYLRTDSPYHAGDEVEGTLYEINEYGAYVAVDDRYCALIPEREWEGEYERGQRLKARVARVLSDGKLDLSVRKKAYLQMADDAEALLKLLTERGGRLPLTDKSDPELIRKECRMSKNAFKRAVGRLLKQGKIRLAEDGIERSGK